MAQLSTGGCLCGGLRYEAAVKPDTGYYCNCRDCQIGSGSAFHVAVFTDETNFRVTDGEYRTWSKAADSGRMVHRMFCGTCGTPVFWTGDGFPGTVLVTISSLDDPDAHRPVHEGWTDSAVSWNRIDETVSSYPGRPERG